MNISAAIKNPATPNVLQFKNLHIEGNITPPAWYRQITWATGKPYAEAVALLADIVYWYRPVEIRDEETGQLVGYGKKFKADQLQRSYDAFAEQFGFTKRQVKAAIDRLVELGLITREFRNLTLSNGAAMNNVMFVAPVHAAILRLNVPSTYAVADDDLRQSVPQPTPKRRTNTEVTTQNPTETKTTTMPTTTDQPTQSDLGGGDSEANASLGKRAATRPEAPSSPIPPAPPSPPPPLGCNPPDPATNTYDYLRQQGVSKKRAAEFAHLDRGQIAAWWEAEQRRDPEAPAGRLVLRLEGSPAQFQAPPPTPAGDKYPRPEWVNDSEEWAAMCRATPTMAKNLEGSRWENGQLVGESDYMTAFYAEKGYAERITMARALQQGRAAA